LWDGKQLSRAVKQGRSFGVAGVEDYAYILQALTDYAEFTHDEQVWKLAQVIAQQAWQRFYSDKGWSLSEQSLLKYGSKKYLLADDAMASPSALIIKSSQLIAKRLKDKSLSKNVQSVIRLGADRLTTEAFWYASHVNVVLSSLRE